MVKRAEDDAQRWRGEALAEKLMQTNQSSAPMAARDQRRMLENVAEGSVWYQRVI